MKKIIGFFYESEGVKSMMRLISFLIVIYSFLITSFVVYTEGYSAAIATFSAIIAFAIGGKLIQKGMESKPPTP